VPSTGGFTERTDAEVAGAAATGSGRNCLSTEWLLSPAQQAGALTHGAGFCWIEANQTKASRLACALRAATSP
jgi:hypothetical protein